MCVLSEREGATMQHVLPKPSRLSIGKPSDSIASTSVTLLCRTIEKKSRSSDALTSCAWAHGLLEIKDTHRHRTLRQVSMRRELS